MGNIFSKLNSSTSLACNLLKARISKRPVPFIVNFQVTKTCNMRCVYCYADLFPKQVNSDFSTKEIFSQVDDLYACGTRWIRLMGGEPLMRDDIGEIIDYIKRKKMFCELSTNGYLVSKKIKDVRKVDAICMSIDGNEEVTDLMRGKGSYRKAVEATKVCWQNNLGVRYHACITKYTNKDCVDSLARFAKEYGYGFNFAQYSYATSKKDEISPTDEQVREIFETALEYKKNGFPVLTSYITLEKLIHWPFPYAKIIYPEDIPKIPFSIKRCQYRRLNISLNSDGRIFPCTKLFNYGLNYLEVGLDKALDHINNLNCILCANAGELEMNLLLSFNPRVIYNGLRYMLT